MDWMDTCTSFSFFFFAKKVTDLIIATSSYYYEKHGIIIHFSTRQGFTSGRTLMPHIHREIFFSTFSFRLHISSDGFERIIFP